MGSELEIAIEIEDYNGNTLCVIHINKKIFTKDIIKFHSSNFADEKSTTIIYKDDSLILVEEICKICNIFKSKGLIDNINTVCK